MMMMNEEEQFYIQLLDTIHCYFVHGYDTGYVIDVDDFRIEDTLNNNQLFYDSQLSN